LEYNRNSINKWLQGNTEKPLVVQVNSTFYKKLVYQEIQDAKYNGFLKATQRDSKHLEISRMKEEDKKQNTLNVCVSNNSLLY
jgi:poly(A)-specific ribonuclease